MPKIHHLPDDGDLPGITCQGEFCYVCKIRTLLDEISQLPPATQELIREMAQFEYEAGRGE